MLRSIAASSGQRARKAGEQGRSESESNHPEREQRFYLPSQSLVKAGTFAYLRARWEALVNFMATATAVGFFLEFPSASPRTVG